VIGPARLHPARSLTGARVWPRRPSQRTTGITSIGLARRRPSCHAKRLARWTLWLDETLPAPVPHRQVVLTIPKRLRPYCLYRRALLGDLARLPVRIVTDGGFRPGGTFVRWPGWPAYDSRVPAVCRADAHRARRALPVRDPPRAPRRRRREAGPPRGPTAAPARRELIAIRPA